MFFVYDGLQLSSWSSNQFVPSAASVTGPFNIKLLKAGNGSYLAKKWYLGENRFLIGIIPLVRKYTITNDYLKTEWNQKIFPSSNFDILEPDANLGLPICAQDECAFRVSFLQTELPTHEGTKIVAIILISVCVFLLVVCAYEFIRKIKSIEVQFVLLYIVCIAFRYAMITWNFP